MGQLYSLLSPLLWPREGQDQVQHDAHHLFPSEHTLTATCSMEGHLRLQAVSAEQGISCASAIARFLGCGEVTGRQTAHSAGTPLQCAVLQLRLSVCARNDTVHGSRVTGGGNQLTRLHLQGVCGSVCL